MLVQSLLSDVQARSVLEAVAPTSPDADKRCRDCALRLAKGETLQSIAESHGVTAERVRQIIESSPWPSAQIRTEAARVREGMAADLKAAAVAWSEANPGIPLTDGAKTLGVPEEQLRAALGRDARRHLTAPQRRAAGRASDDDLLAALRACHDESGTITGASYRAWAKQHGVPGPQTVAQRFGSWNAALTASGTKDAPPISRVRTHTDADLWAALIQGLRRAPSATAREWDDWTQTQPGVPSLALVRNRLGLPWAQLRHEALAAIAGTTTRCAQWLADVTTPRDWETLRRERQAFDPVETVRAAIRDCGPTLSIAAYTEWARSHDAPSSPTLTAAAGTSWAELVRTAGGRVQPRALHTDESIAASIRDYRSDTGAETLSERDYQEWAAQHDRVSIKTIYRRFPGRGGLAEAMMWASDRDS